MCLSNVYVDVDGKRELLIEEVASMEVRNDELLLNTLFGERKELKASIRQIDFMTHSILLENLKDK